MTKHYCEICGEEITSLNELVTVEVRIRRGLPRLTRTAEYRADCVDKALGRGFTESVKAEAEGAELKRKAAERKVMREAKTNE